MKRTYLIITALFGTSCMLNAQQTTGVIADNLKIERNGEYMVVDMNMNLSHLDVESNRAVLLTPRFISTVDTLELSSVGVYGRQRYYYYVRNGESMLSGKDEMSFKARSKPESVVYHAIVPYYKWMNGASLELYRSDYGCCNTLLAEWNDPLGSYVEALPFSPQLLYIHPQAETVKHRSLSGSAFIDFPVDKTVIYPEYRRNTYELGKIQASIDSVRNDKDVVITSVWLKGYASPEGDFNYNKSLAQRRTQTLSNYISSQYPALKKAPVYRTEGVGEDWEGLKAAVSGSTLSNKDKILFIIEHNSNDTERESAIRELDNDKTYHILLEEFYPALRRTTFSLSFDVRPYTSEELPGVFETKPECLSLYEMYQLAGLYASRGENPLPVYKKAYEQFPGDIVAVLNYANALLKYGKDADGALQVLEVVREDSRVLFPMAIAYDMKGDWRKAEKLLEEAAARGCNRAKAFKAVRVNE